MLKATAGRLIAILVTWLFILGLLFIVFYVVPGDPVRIMMGVDSDTAREAILRANLGLDGSRFEQFTRMFTGLFDQADPTRSVRFGQPVLQMIVQRLPVTVGLAFMAFVLVMVLAIPFGILASIRPGGLVDRVITVGSQALLSLPGFFVGILLTWIFGVILHLYLPGSYVAPSQDLGGYLRALLIPALALAIPKLAVIVQFQRDRLVALHHQDWVRTARGKGATEKAVLFRHMLRNSFVPVVTTLGIVLAELLAGSLVVEQVFRLPGLGILMLTAIEARDYPLVMGMVLFISGVIVLINVVTDLVIRRVDPRLRREDPDRLVQVSVLGPAISEPDMGDDIPGSSAGGEG